MSTNSRRILRSVYALISVVALAQLCHAEEVVFGHISSVANPASVANAKDLRAGIQLAFTAANAGGGVNGNQLKLELRDDALDTQKMVALTGELIADPRVVGLVGFLNTGGLTELAKADVFGKNGIAMIAPFQGNANIVQATNVFPFRSGYNDEVAALLKEAKGTFKERVAIVNWNIAFGPPVSKYAQERSKELGLPIVATVEIDAKPNGDLPGSIEKALATLRQAKAGAVIMIAAGKPAELFVAALRKSDLASTYIYAMSVILPEGLVANLGEKAAHGVVISQATPYPYVGTTALVLEYQHELREFSPTQLPTFSHLEGFAAGKIAIRALAKTGPKPTRQSLIQALNSLGTLDLGGYTVSYSPKARRGWGGIELVIIGRGGKVFR
jgi:branched-chain amino acid transport system substrate-binding protein